MKATVNGILVLFPALRAEHEIFHGRIRAVIRDIDHDGVARSAVGAVCERILKASIGEIKQLISAVIASGEVRENVDRLAGIRVAGVNLEAGGALSRNPCGFVNRDNGSFGALVLQPLLERYQFVECSFHFDHQSG